MGVYSIKKSQEQFEKEVYNINSKVKIIGEYKSGIEGVKTQCLVDGYIWYPKANNLIRGHGCPVCSNRIALKGYNDISTTHPNFLKYFNDINDAYNNRWGSHKKVLFKCPDCGNLEYKVIKNVITQGYSCNNCGDYISYPNKYIRCFIKQLNVENVHYEYSPKWAKGYFYDSYFEYKNKKYIIEMDGDFHYKNNRMTGQSKKEIQSIDIYKDKLAFENNVYIIRIETRKSDSQYIENNIKHSVLSTIFDLSKINWEKCNEFATSNYIKYFCDFYEQNKFIYSKNEMCNILGISESTYINYRNQGIKLGWCTYNQDEKSIILSMNFNTKISKAIIVKDVNTGVVNKYKSISLGAKMISKELNKKVYSSDISKVLSKNINRYLNYEIKYA